jgi:hypothetical protein
VQIDTATGLATDLNALSDGFDIQALAFSSDGVLYAASNDLFSFDTGSGAASFVATIGGVNGAGIRGLEFASPVPERGTWALFGLGLALFSGCARGVGPAGRAGRRPAGSAPAH